MKKRTKRFPSARLILALGVTALLLSALIAKPTRVVKAAAFTGDNLVIFVVGPGNAAGGAMDDSATQVSLIEYTLTGTLVQSIPMPTSVVGLNKRLTATGTASSEGLLTRSTNGLYLILAGYDAALGTAGGTAVGGTAGSNDDIGNSSAAIVNRVIGRVDNAGTVDTTTALTDAFDGTSANFANIRGATSTNGTDLWVSGNASSNAGIRYTTLGATTSTQLATTPTNLRATNIFDGQLYISANTGTTRLATVGTGTPITSGQTITNLPGFSTASASPYGFYFADLTGTVAGVDTLYVALDSPDEIQKWSLVGGTWTLNGSYSVTNPTGLTGFTNTSTSTVTLFATSATNLYTVTDGTTYNVAPTGTLTSIATPPSLSLFRGIAFAPLSPTAADSTVSGTITDDQGRAVAGTVVHLSGSQHRKTITNARGFYQFDKVETTGFYTVTPARANYSFSPSNRSFSQLGNHTDAAFTGSSSGDNLNPIDTPEYFVRQQYVDVLGREPDEGGFNYWSDEILHCGNNAACVNARRSDIAAAFFIEQEFQQTGAFIYGLYQGSLGRRPVVGEYSSDRKQVVGGANLDSHKAAFAELFVQRAEFVQKYPAQITPEVFVDALLEQVWESSKVDLAGDRSLLLAIYQTGSGVNQSRSRVLQHVIEAPEFKRAEYNPAFVLTEYFSYLQRNPEPEGYDFWLNVINNGAVGNYRGMVCSFITSTEYQKRFSSVVTHSNAECGQ